MLQAIFKAIVSDLLPLYKIFFGNSRSNFKIYAMAVSE